MAVSEKKQAVSDFLLRVDQLHADPKMVSEADKFYKKTSTLSERDLLRKFTI
jgi:hypothetical protein